MKKIAVVVIMITALPGCAALGIIGIVAQTLGNVMQHNDMQTQVNQAYANVNQDMQYSQAGCQNGDPNACAEYNNAVTQKSNLDTQVSNYNTAVLMRQQQQQQQQPQFWHCSGLGNSVDCQQY